MNLYEFCLSPNIVKVFFSPPHLKWVENIILDITLWIFSMLFMICIYIF